VRTPGRISEEGAKMRGSKLVGTYLAAAAMIAACVTPASASAAKQLVLSESGVAAAVGSTGDTGLALAGCTIFSNGTVTANEAPKATLAAATNTTAECGGEALSESGTITETRLTATGQMTLKGKIQLTFAGPCVYLYTKFKGTFSLPGTAVIEGVTTGKANIRLSAGTCTIANTQEFLAYATDEAFGPPFEAALKP
jgi:hypothetical protein